MIFNLLDSADMNPPVGCMHVYYVCAYLILRLVAEVIELASSGTCAEVSATVRWHDQRPTLRRTSYFPGFQGLERSATYASNPIKTV